VTRSGEFLFH